MSMFASYNKNNAKGTLVGNWVEEEALRSVTGFARRQVPEPKGPSSPERASPEKEKDVPESTHKRVLQHADENGRTTYETTVQASTNYGDGVIRVAPGPRSSLRETQIIEAAKRLRDQELAAQRDAKQRELAEARALSTVKTSFHAPETATLVASTRVPRGRNGARVIDNSVAHLTRGQVDSLDKAKLDVLMQQQPHGGIPVTRYSYAVATGVGLDFGSTTSDSQNPFARSSTFTNDIRDPSKRVAEATEPASLHDERVGMSVHQRSALKQLVQYCKQHPTRWQQLKQDLAARASASNNLIQLPEFRAVVSGSGDVVSDKDAIHAFMHFDLDHIGAIALDDFVSFCDSQTLHRTL